MAMAADIAGSFALDARGMDALRLQAKSDPNQAIKAAAQQFEALFMNMLMKSMREATPQDGLFDSEQTKMYTSMLDQQLAQHLSARGVGLADVMARQLQRTQGVPPDKSDAQVSTQPAAKSPAKNVSAQDFVDRLLPGAVEASRTTGIPAAFMIGQAALETGWGRREIMAADGTPSHNLFGIKAGKNWKGPVVEAVTTEFVDGAPRKTVESFRAYDSYADSLRDYAALMKNSPRYARVLQQGADAAGFATALAQSGYATDPAYADKLRGVLAAPRLRSIA